jgi:hypothetical protein
MIFPANGFLRLRDQREIEGQNKKASNSGKTGNEGILRIPMKIVHRAGLILLFDGEVGPALRDHDEHNQTGILTSASNLTPAFPVFIQWHWEFVAVTVAQPSRIHTGFPDI